MRGKEGMSKKIRHVLELDDLLSSGDALQMSGNYDLTVSGVGHFLHYGENDITLSLKNYILKIEGEGLYCCSYLGGVVRVGGDIASLRFEKRMRGSKNEKSV